MPMDENYRAVFGDYEEPGTETKTQPAEGENTQEVTQPANKAEETEPAGTGTAAAGSEEEPSKEQPAAAEEPAKEQSPEERHRQAEARRAREDAAAAQALRARVDKIYADMFEGQTDPFTGKPITTEAEYKAYQTAKQRQEQDKVLQDAGIQPDAIGKLIDERVAQHPAVVQAQKAAQDAALEKARALEREAQTAISEEVRKISAIDPNIKSLQDIAAMPTAQQFNEYVQKGLSLEDAFYLANRKDISTKNQEAAKQAAINQTRSKQHLNSGAGSGGAGESVPPDKAAEYREWFPDATDDEIRKEYEKFRKALR